MTTDTTRFLRLSLTTLAMAALAACGGGGTPDAAAPDVPVTPVAPAAPVTLSGIAATGAAFTGGTVTVIDSTGAVVGTSAVVGEDGAFSVTLSATAKAPFVLMASRTTADGQTQSLVSVAESASVTQINVTPVTSLIAARLSSSGDPAKLAAEVAAGTATITAQNVATTIADVNTLLTPVLQATGTSLVTNPITTAFAVDGAGYDRLLDTVNVTITPTRGGSNIEVGIKSQTAEGQQPPVIQFTSSASVASVTLPTVNAADLVPAGTSVLISDFLKALTACYALPLESRVNNASASSTNVTGTAADVKAAECKSVFTGADPASYLHNGSRVGRDGSNNGAFAGLFRRGATGVVFNQGTYEFTRGNGDFVVGYKSRDSAGAEQFDTLVVRKDTSDGKLKLIGNQYTYPGGVVAYHQARQFITLDQSAFNHHSTGYDLRVANVTNGAGTPLLDRVEVLTPKGSTLVLKPQAGTSNLNLVKPSGITGTSYLRLRSAYDASTTAGHPRDKDTGLFFAGTEPTEAEVAAIPAHSVWKFSYFAAGNTGSTPDAVQSYKTRARALTLAELQAQALAELAPGLVTTLQSLTQVSGNVALPNSQPVTGADYVVPAGALPPTSIKIFGRMLTNASPVTFGARFDDSTSLASTARTASVACSAATNSDLHCGTGGAFAQNAYANGVHLLARDSTGREYAQFYAMYRLN